MEKKVKNRIEFIDMMRIFACFLVVLTHAVLENKAENGVYLGAMSFLCSPSSELFLALSGAVLLPVKVPMDVFYKKRFLKLIPPLVVWSIFGCILQYSYSRVSLQDAINLFINIPLKPVIGVYWFMYVMIGLYLFAPFISYWLREATKKQVELFLGIWLFSMITPWFNMITPDYYDQDGSYYWPLCYFGGFLGYWVLGYYCKTYPLRFKSRMGVAIMVSCALYFVVIVLMKAKGIETACYVDNLQWGSVSFVAFYFMLFKAISETSFSKKYLNSLCSRVAPYSFGIYLLHVWILSFGLKLFMRQHRMMDHPIIESLLLAISTMICSFAIIKIMSLYKPIGKWLFGLNN